MNNHIKEAFVNLLTATELAAPSASQLEIALAVGATLFEESVKQSIAADTKKATVLDKAYASGAADGLMTGKELNKHQLDEAVELLRQFTSHLRDKGQTSGPTYIEAMAFLRRYHHDYRHCALHNQGD